MAGPADMRSRRKATKMASKKRAAPKKHSSEPTGLTFATLETKRGRRLGLRTAQGILDVDRFRIRRT